jgi:hypothetical protein
MKYIGPQGTTPMKMLGNARALFHRNRSKPAFRSDTHSNRLATSSAPSLSRSAPPLEL